MNKIILIVFLLGFFFNVNAQIKPTLKKVRKMSKTEKLNKTSDDSGSEISTEENSTSKSTTSKGVKDKDLKISDYLIISHLRDTTYVDTTLSIKKEYKFNYLRKDNFNLMAFSNMGQTYNTLSSNFENTTLLPDFSARARHFNYMEVEDISYYHVPTPLSEMFYKSAFKQGQLLDALFTVNTSKQLNFSIAYKGMRSLGRYQHLLTSTGNFRFTTSYKTKNRRYILNTHFVSQDLMNEENGGVKDDYIPFFESGDKDFLDRGVLEVNFENAESILKGKRFYFNHSFDIIKQVDSLPKNKLDVTHVMTLKDKKFLLSQSSAEASFGDTFSGSIRDESTLEEFSNQLQLNYTNKTLGAFQINATQTDYNYGYDKLVILNGSTITNRLKGDIFAVGGKYKKQIKGFLLEGELGANVSGDFDGNFAKAKAYYKINDDISLAGQFNHSVRMPNYNALLNQSDYKNYNWQNEFNTIKTEQLAFHLKSKKLANVSVDFTTINDHVYFSKIEETTEDDVALQYVKPFQNDKSISYLRLKLNREIKYRNMALDNTFMYQKVTDENKVFNVPEIIGRSTLYYSNRLFKKALLLQTGVTVNYFTQYHMNGYDHVLAEFYTQNDVEYGGFPRLDFFVNGKIRQARIFIKAEHFNAGFTGRNYYSAPNTPYRDFTVRFGIVWNFFM